MSILIKGMGMPKTCCTCKLSIGSCCAITGYKPTFEEWYEDGVKNCPLVEVPPHGRLIDADAVKKIIQDNDYPLIGVWNSVDNGMWTVGIFQAIDEAQTIIPAEKEDT